MKRRSFLLCATAAAACGATSLETPPADAERRTHERLAAAAEARTFVQVVYDPAYVAIDYPGGDVADDRGVCTDVVIRAYRGVGVDLQHLVHEDMLAEFDAYPKLWGLVRPDPNIDHRRVPNLETFLTRAGAALGDEVRDEDLAPGDLATWRVNGRPHIGIASTRRGRAGRMLFVHNIGAGPQFDPCYDLWPRTGVCRYRPWAV